MMRSHLQRGIETLAAIDEARVTNPGCGHGIEESLVMKDLLELEVQWRNDSTWKIWWAFEEFVQDVRRIAGEV